MQFLEAPSGNQAKCVASAESIETSRRDWLIQRVTLNSRFAKPHFVESIAHPKLPSECELSVVIPTHNRHRQLIRLVESLAKQSVVREIEVLIISNFKDSFLDREVPVLAERTGLRVRLLSANQMGANSARNLGLRNARASVVLFIDDDCWVEDRFFILKHIEHHRKFLSTICLGGNYLLPSKKPRSCELAYQLTSDFWLEGMKLDDSRTQGLVGGNLSVKTQLLTPLLYFDESIDYGGSEMEWENRLLEAGHEMRVFSDLSLVHGCEVDWLSLAQKAYKQGFTAQLISTSRDHGGARFKNGVADLASFAAKNLEKSSLGVRFAILVYQRSFEFGQQSAASKPNSPPCYSHLSFLKFFFAREISSFSKTVVYPRLRSLLYLLRLHRHS